MHIMDILQASAAVGSLLLIVLGSQYLKRRLKAMY